MMQPWLILHRFGRRICNRGPIVAILPVVEDGTIALARKIRDDVDHCSKSSL